MRFGYTKAWAETRRRKKLVIRRGRWPISPITPGKATATVWFSFRSLPDRQFAMFTLFSSAFTQSRGLEPQGMRCLQIEGTASELSSGAIDSALSLLLSNDPIHIERKSPWPGSKVKRPSGVH
jgi:hypothetical protein